MKILVYRSPSQNNVLTGMSVSLAAALSDLGADTTLLPLGGADWAQTLVGALNGGGFDYVVSFGSFSADLVTGDGRSVYDVLGCGFVGWDVDHPAYQFQRFTTRIGDRLQVCASNSHFRFEAMMGCRTAESLMLPGVDAVVPDPAPLEERSIPVTVAMSWLGEPEIWWDEWKGTPAHTLIQGMVDRLMADREVDLLRAYQETLAATGLQIGFDQNICNILARVGLFLRQHDRMRLAEALAAGETPCVIHGAGWSERLGQRSHIRYGEALDYSDVGALYRDSRVVLNLNAANGASERAILGMASGAVVVSDYSALLQSQFEAKGGLRFYDRRDPSGVTETLDAVLASAEAQAVADRGRELVAAGCLWSHKAAALLETLQSRKLARRLQAVGVGR
jgi:hypothetical protein